MSVQLLVLPVLPPPLPPPLHRPPLPPPHKASTSTHVKRDSPSCTRYSITTLLRSTTGTTSLYCVIQSLNPCSPPLRLVRVLQKKCCNGTAMLGYCAKQNNLPRRCWRLATYNIVPLGTFSQELVLPVVAKATKATAKKRRRTTTIG